MDDREFEEMLRGLLGSERPAGGESFREALLARCLDIVRAGALGDGGNGEHGDGRGRQAGARELSDGELELLAAAGDPAPFGGRPPKGG